MTHVSSPNYLTKFLPLHCKTSSFQIASLVRPPKIRPSPSLVSLGDESVPRTVYSQFATGFGSSHSCSSAPSERSLNGLFSEHIFLALFTSSGCRKTKMTLARGVIRLLTLIMACVWRVQSSATQRLTVRIINVFPSSDGVAATIYDGNGAPLINVSYNETKVVTLPLNSSIQVARGNGKKRLLLEAVSYTQSRCGGGPHCSPD